MVLAGYLVGSVSRSTNSDGATTIRVVIDGRAAPPERLAAAKACVESLAAYADLAGITANYDTGDVGVPVPVLVLAGVVSVAVVAAQAYVMIQVADRAGSIVDNALKRNAASSEIQRADAQVLKLVNNHVQREIAAGTTLPIDEATRMAIQGLHTRVGSLVQAGYQKEEEKGFPVWVLPALGVTAAAVVTAIIVYKKKGIQHGQH
jgi:hypothetical protein